MSTTLVLGVVLTGGCRVSADYGGTAYACDEAMTCPSDQTCVSGRCEDNASVVDARPGQADARTGDAAGTPDALVDLPSSCLALYQLGERASGVYSIKPATPPRSPRQVYCEMETDGGGWTVVGRTAVGGVGSFGWRVDAGSPTNGDAPYSLDARILGPFTEVLIATRADSGLGIGDTAFRIAMPGDFINAYQRTGTADLVPVPVVGTCEPLGYPLALVHWGHTVKTDQFFFDVTAVERDAGLDPNGLDIEAGDCDVPLDNRPGMLLVR